MSAPIRPKHLHHDSYHGSAKASAVAVSEVAQQREPYWSALDSELSGFVSSLLLDAGVESRGKGARVDRPDVWRTPYSHGFCGHVTCIMVVTWCRFSLCNTKASVGWPVPLLAASSESASGGASSLFATPCTGSRALT